MNSNPKIINPFTQKRIYLNTDENDKKIIIKNCESQKYEGHKIIITNNSIIGNISIYIKHEHKCLCKISPQTSIGLIVNNSNWCVYFHQKKCGESITTIIDNSIKPICYRLPCNPKNGYTESVNSLYVRGYDVIIKTCTSGTVILSPSSGQNKTFYYDSKTDPKNPVYIIISGTDTFFSRKQQYKKLVEKNKCHHNNESKELRDKELRDKELRDKELRDKELRDKNTKDKETKLKLGATLSATKMAVTLSADGNTAAVAYLKSYIDQAPTYNIVIFERQIDQWVQIQNIAGLQLSPGTVYQISISITSDGSIIALGISVPLAQTGRAVIVYRRQVNYTLLQLINLTNPASDSNTTGAWVSLSQGGDVLAIGVTNSFSSGDILVSNINPEIFPPRYETPIILSTNLSDIYNNLGHTVSVSSDGLTLIAGTGISNPIAQNSDCIIFYFENGQWTVGELLSSGIYSTVGNLNQSVNIAGDGQTIVIGRPDETNGKYLSIYYRTGSRSWRHDSIVTSSVPNDREGYSVCLSGNGKTLAVGAPGTGNVNYNIGRTIIYNLSGVQWIFRSNLVGAGSIIPTTIAGGVQQGFSVYLSSNGSTTITCGPGDNNGIGASWIFV